MGTQRKLPNRRKKPCPGRAIRVSKLVYEMLDKSRRGRSWDCLFRRMLGLPDRYGVEQPLIEGMLEVHTGMLILKLANASWLEVEETAFKAADRIAAKLHVKRQAPIPMRKLR